MRLVELGEADDRRNEVWQDAGVEVLQDPLGLADELVEEDAVMGRLERLELGNAFGQLVARASPVAPLQVQQPGGMLMPVPTAVPPSGSSASRGRAARRRSMPARTWAA